MAEGPPATPPVEVVEKRMLLAICEDWGAVVAVESFGARVCVAVPVCVGAGGRACVWVYGQVRVCV